MQLSRRSLRYHKHTCHHHLLVHTTNNLTRILSFGVVNEHTTSPCAPCFLLRKNAGWVRSRRSYVVIWFCNSLSSIASEPEDTHDTLKDSIEVLHDGLTESRNLPPCDLKFLDSSSLGLDYQWLLDAQFDEWCLRLPTPVETARASTSRLYFAWFKSVKRRFKHLWRILPVSHLF